MKSTSSACNTSASAKCPMRTLAITGIVTVAMISRITLIEAMRATPPSLRISEGTRSSAITAHAPAFSAILACSALVTSIITPPLSISARPTFTRHSFDPLPPLPLPFTFFTSISLLLSLPEFLDGLSLSNLFLTLLLLPDYHESRPAPRQYRPGRIANLAGHENISSLLLRLASLHLNFFHHIDWLQVLDRQFCSHRADLAKAADLAHRFIQEHCDNPAMRESPASLIAFAKNKPSHNPAIHVVLFERQLHPAGIISAAAETLVRRIRFQHDCLGQLVSSRAFLCFFYLIYVLTSFLQTSATRLRSARRTPRCRVRISIFNNSASVATPRAICFSSRLAKPSRSVFGSGACT